MSVDWNFGDQKPMECKSNFTKTADRAFDEFCKLYLNGPNNMLVNSQPNKEPTCLSNNQIAEFNDDTKIQINTKTVEGTADLRPLKEGGEAVAEDEDHNQKSEAYTTIYDDTNKESKGGFGEDRDSDRQYSFEDVLEVYNRGCRSQETCYIDDDKAAVTLRRHKKPSRKIPAVRPIRNRSSEHELDTSTAVCGQDESVTELFYPALRQQIKEEQQCSVASPKHTKKSRMSRKMRNERAKSLYNAMGSSQQEHSSHRDYEIFTYELDRYLEKLKLAQRELELKLAKVRNSLMVDTAQFSPNGSDILVPNVHSTLNEGDTSFEPVNDEDEVDHDGGEDYCELKSDCFNKKSQTNNNKFDCTRLTPEEVYIATSIPKMTSFHDEFSSHKSQRNKSLLIENELIKLKPAEEAESVSPVPTSDLDAPTSWLSLKVIACGMRKYAQLPIPAVNFFIDKGDFGDDAGFWAETKEGCSCGIADGATGNSQYGYDPGDFSRHLMEQCSELFVSSADITDARDLLLKAYDAVQDKTCFGSCTSCVVALDHSSGVLSAVNIGDSGYCVMRDGAIVHASEPDRLSFECPKQLDSYPWKQESRRMGISYTDILGADTMCDTIEVLKDDIIIISSDGLYDNLDLAEIEQIFHKSKTQMDAAEKLVYNCVKFYRKPDDILVLIAVVVENTTSNMRQIFTKDPSIKSL